jgi:hypothetical protein
MDECEHTLLQEKSRLDEEINNDIVEEKNPQENKPEEQEEG